MRLFLKRECFRWWVKLVLITMVLTVVFPATNLFFKSNQGKALAVDSFDALAIQAVRNNYTLYGEGLPADGGYGHFGAYDAYILTQAGADVSSFVYGEKNLKAEILGLIEDTIAKEGTAEQSSAKRAAQEYLAAKAWGEADKAAQLLTILKDRQAISADGSFDPGVYGIFSSMPAFDALGKAGEIAEIDVAGAIGYILASRDPATKAWPAEDEPNYLINDFQTTAQAVRVLEYLKPYAGDQAADVQTAIEEGKAWLQACQQADGSFLNAYDDPVIDSAEIILTLDCLGIDFTDWKTEDKSAVDYLQEKALNGDGTFGSKTMADNTWVLDACLVLGANVPPGTVLGVKVLPAESQIQVGETCQFTAESLQMDGTFEDVSATAAWSVGDPAIASVDAGGLVTGVAAGNTVLSAAVQGVTGTAVLRVQGTEGGDVPSDPPPQGIPVFVMVTGKSGETLFPQSIVYLSASDRFGVTPVGALDKTGLSFDYDSPEFIHTIAGQRNQGMNGWMYEVNGSLPGAAANECTLSANDRVLWFYSTSSENISSVSGAPVQNPAQPVKTGDDLIREALENNEEVKISFETSENKTVEISPDSIKALSEKDKELSLTGKGLELTFSPQALLTAELTKAREEEKTKLQIGAREVSAAEKQEILDKAKIGQSAGLFEIGGKVFELTACILRENGEGALETENIAGFAEPVQVTLDLANISLTEEDLIKLTAVRYENDAQGRLVPVKLGGTYDPAAKTFTFFTEKFSYYGVLKAEDLLVISMKINTLTTHVNGRRDFSDVPPTLINNRTMVPLRFIAQSMGADVQWLEDIRTVEIRLENRLLRLVIDKTGPGLDTPATIVKGRTLVPLRYVAEELDATVTWYPAEQRVEIIK